VLNNAVYMTLFEEARFRFFTERGLVPGGQFPFLLAQTNVRFVAPGRGGVVVRVHLGNTRVGRSSFEQAYRVEGPQGEIWCEAVAALVVYDPDTRRSAPMSDEFRKALEGESS